MALHVLIQGCSHRLPLSVDGSESTVLSPYRPFYLPLGASMRELGEVCISSKFETNSRGEGYSRPPSVQHQASPRKYRGCCTSLTARIPDSIYISRETCFKRRAVHMIGRCFLNSAVGSNLTDLGSAHAD